MISVSAGRCGLRATSHNAVSMAATEPFVSHAPRPKRRPFLVRGVNCSSVAFTVSRCGASKSRRRALPRGERRASRLARPGAAACNSTSSPARAAVAARNSATRCSPARGCFAGRNAGFTLGSAISSRKSFSVFVMPFPVGKRRGRS